MFSFDHRHSLVKKETEAQQGSEEPVQLSSQGSSFGVTQAWAWILALLWTSCVTLGKWLTISVLCSSHPWNGDSDSVYLRMERGTKEMLGPFLAHSKLSQIGATRIIFLFVVILLFFIMLVRERAEIQIQVFCLCLSCCYTKLLSSA